MQNSTTNLTGININSQQNLQNQNEIVEISISQDRVVQENAETRVAQGQQIGSGLLRVGEALLIRESENFVRRLAEEEQRQFIHTSGVFNPQYNFFNNLLSSESIRVINKSSLMALYSLALTAEVIGGIACYCSVKFPENAMNGANITGANFTGANILGNATETRDECMKEKMPYGILATLSLVGLMIVSGKIIDSFKSRRSRSEVREGAPQNEMTNRVNQQANTTNLVADIAMVSNPNQI